MSKLVTLQQSDGIGHIRFPSKHGPPVIGEQFVEELGLAVEAVIGNKLDRCIIYDDCAGADVEMIATASEAEVRRIITNMHKVLNMIEDSKKFLAVMQAACLGGGLEIALACAYRAMDDNAKAQFPECGLSIIPGFFGGPRAARLIGAFDQSNPFAPLAYSMVLLCTEMPAVMAHSVGLTDIVLPTIDADKNPVTVQARDKMIADFLRVRESMSQVYGRIVPGGTHVGGEFMGAQGVLDMLAMLKSGNQKMDDGAHDAVRREAVKIAADVIYKTRNMSREDGQAYELEKFIEALKHRQAKNMLRLYLAPRRMRGLPESLPEPRDIRKVAVLGGLGNIGSEELGRLFKAAMAGKIDKIAGYEIDEELAAMIPDKVVGVLRHAINKKKDFTEEALRAFMAEHCVFTGDITKLAGYELYLDCTFEDLEEKRKLFRKLCEVVAADAIIASVSSTFGPNELSEGMPNPERFIGWHPFSPVLRMNPTENVRGDKTNDQAVADLHALSVKLKFMPFNLRDNGVRAFVVNSVLCAMMVKVFEFLAQGVLMEEIEEASSLQLLPNGLLQLLDEVGLPVGAALFKNKFPELAVKMPILDNMIEAGRKGRKATGMGFYEYEADENEKTTGFNRTGLWQGFYEFAGVTPKAGQYTIAEIRETLIKAAFEMAVEVKEAGVIDTFEELDLLCQNAIGAYPYGGGPYTQGVEELGLVAA